METWRRGDVETWKHGVMEIWRHGDMDMETSNGKRKPRRFSLVRLPFAHHAKGSLLFVRFDEEIGLTLSVRKQTKGTCPFIAGMSLL
jgi:hypothetical protein